MKNIDFLPAKYREGYAARSAVVRRWVILLAMIATLAPLATYQYLSHRRVALSLTAIEPAHAEALEQVRRLDEMQRELQQASDEAALIAYLGHPWPRTQVLEHLRSTLPDAVRLTNIVMQYEAKQGTPGAINPGRSRAARRAAENNEAKSDDQRSPAQRDLAQLIEHSQANETVIMLEGVTIDTTDLHTYVAKLRVTGLFAKSELKSLESVASQDSARAQKFEIRLSLAPGHSQLPKSMPAGDSAASTANKSATTLEMAKHP